MGLRITRPGHRTGERGASAVEFALIIPLFLMLIMGMLTTGITYFRQLAMASGAREASRMGATLPTGKVSIASTWFDQIAERAIQSSDGQLAHNVTGQYTCVAYVGYGSPESSTNDWTQKREQNGAAAATYTAGALSTPSSWCFDDGRGSSERRVQVLVKRTSPMNVIFFGSNLHLTTQSVTRYEAITP